VSFDNHLGSTAFRPLDFAADQHQLRHLSRNAFFGLTWTAIRSSAGYCRRTNWRWGIFALCLSIGKLLAEESGLTTPCGDAK
jgi:hypothetical protein